MSPIRWGSDSADAPGSGRGGRDRPAAGRGGQPCVAVGPPAGLPVADRRTERGARLAYVGHRGVVAGPRSHGASHRTSQGLISLPLAHWPAAADRVTRTNGAVGMDVDTAAETNLAGCHRWVPSSGPKQSQTATCSKSYLRIRALVLTWLSQLGNSPVTARDVVGRVSDQSWLRGTECDS